MPNRRSRARGWLRAAACAALTSGGVAALSATPAAAVTRTASQCAFPNAQYQHVIYVQFDNTHLRRDNPSVPSDLEQIPALRNFLADNGSLMADDHHAPARPAAHGAAAGGVRRGARRRSVIAA